MPCRPTNGDLSSRYGKREKTSKILGGFSNVSSGIGSLRTHAGDAHGRGKKVARVDSRIARLAIHSASTVALFLIETWQEKKKS